MAFRFLSPNRGPPPLPPKDDHHVRPLSPSSLPYTTAASISHSNLNENLSSSSSIMSTNNKLSIASFLSKFPKSSKEAASPNDEGISLPWNFQHHIHVDEGFVGLPPSWLTSTFTEEEIAQIQSRRTAVLHGVGGGYHQMRPPSPTTELYPSVIQGHRRNKSSVESVASSSTPNLALPSMSSPSQHPLPHLPQSLSSTNLAHLPSSPPAPLRSPSPAPTNASSTQLQLHPQHPPFSQQQPTTPSSSSFPLAPRNIFSDLSSASSNIVGAVKSSAGKGMRLLRVKRRIGLGIGDGSTSPPSSFENSSTNRKKVHSRLSDETFFPPEIVSPDRATVGSRVVSPTNLSSPPTSGGAVAPVWELYTTSKPSSSKKVVGSTTTPHHTRQRSMSSSVHSHTRSLSTSSGTHQSNPSSSSTFHPNASSSSLSNPKTLSPSRSPSFSNSKNTNPYLSRSLSRSRSFSSGSGHPYAATSSFSTQPLPVLSSHSVSGPSSSTSSLPPSSPPSSTTHPTPHRPLHLVSHSHSGSMSSLVSIPEASPAPGAVVPFPVPPMPPAFDGLGLKRKGSKHLGVNGYGHHRNLSTSTSASTHSQTNLAGAGSSSAHSHSNQKHKQMNHSKHQHTPSTSSQQSTSSQNSNQSTTSQAVSSHSHTHSNSSSQSISSSNAESNGQVPELPVLKLSLPRLSFSLPFGEEGSLFGAAFGLTSTPAETGKTGEGGTSWSGSTSGSSGSAVGLGQVASSSTSGLSRWFDNTTATPTNVNGNGITRGDRPGTSGSNSYASGSGSKSNVASGSGLTVSRLGQGSGSGNTNATASGSGSSGVGASGSGSELYPPPPLKPIPSSSTTLSTLTFPSTSGVGASSSTSNLASSSRLTPNPVSTSTPNLASISTSNQASTSTSSSNPTSTFSTLPPNSNTSTSASTSTIPILTGPSIPARTQTPPRITSVITAKGSPPRRRPLPSSKPYPGYPVPALPSSSSSLKDAAGPTKLIPVPATPFSPFGIPAVSARHPYSPLPVPPVASGSGSDPGPSTNANLPHPPQQRQPNAASHLSPPPVSAMISPNGMLSPTSPLSTTTSAAQSPNSAQLWSEIAHMMDPGMMSGIPGLHLSTALPEDARDAVRRAGEGGWVGEGSEEDRKEGRGETRAGGKGKEGQGGVVLVGDLVGPSPPASADLDGGVKESSMSRVEERRELAEDDGSESEEEDEDEELYDGVVQSVVVARPHPMPQPQALVIEPLRTVGRPRLVNVNGSVGAQKARSKEEGSVERKGEDVNADVELEFKNSTFSKQEDNKAYSDSVRSSTTTIVPSGLRGVGDHTSAAGVNGQGDPTEGAPTRTNERSQHRPPSMKLWTSNGIGNATSFAGNGIRAESSAMATMGTMPVAGQGTGLTDGEGNATPYLAYYLEDTDMTPSPLPSPGSALGSPLLDDPMLDEDEDGEGGGGLSSGLELESTASSSFSAMYSSRRFGFEDGNDEEYRLSYLTDDAEKRNSRVVGARNGSEGGGDEDDFYVDYSEDEGKGGNQSRALPLTTPTIVLNDGAHSPAKDDDDTNTRINKAPINGDPFISASSSATDLTDNSLSLPPSPSPQQRYCGWVSTLVAPLSEFIDDAVDPRDHYQELTEIAEGESGSVYAAKVNKANARKLRLGEVVRMQDLDDLGLVGDDNENVHNDNADDTEEKTKLVAIKSIALVPSGTPKLVDLLRELNLMRGLWHSQVLSVDAVYVDLVEDSVWLRMELMDRSLADVIVLVDSGLVLQERTIARFASDALLALDFLLRHNIAHRDVRSDNMLINNQGILKLADFTNAVRVDPTEPLHTDVVGVLFWQAPELLLHNTTTNTPSTTHNPNNKNTERTVPPYDPLKLDVWSLGSTVWEMAETIPPFSDTNQFEDRWPPLSRPTLYSPAFHEFLRMCSEPAASRPSAAELLQAHFINNACGRPVIAQLLAQCRTIEWGLRERTDDPLS